MEAQMLALLVEVTSIPAAGQQMKEPITGLTEKVSNATEASKSEQAPATPEQRDAAFKKGIGVLAATAKRVNRG